MMFIRTPLLPPPLHPRRHNGFRLAVLIAGLASLASCVADSESVTETRSALTTRPNLYFSGGPMRNFTVNLMFWGDFQETERNFVKSYLANFASLVNGGFSPPGKDPAVRYYGLWGLIPGNWINDPNPIPSSAAWGNKSVATDLGPDEFATELHAATIGTFGPSFDAWGNPDYAGLPIGNNNLRMVITKGANYYELATAVGSHTIDNQGYAFGYAMYDANGPNTIGFGPVLSHEIQEAMTDASPTSGWATNEDCVLGVCVFHEEGCDYCDLDNSFAWLPNPVFGGYLATITPINKLTLNPSFSNDGLPADSCQLWEPEQYAPMTATYEFGGLLQLYYRGTNGHIFGLTWDGPGQSATGPVDIGQPLAGVAGKPSVAFALSDGGEYLFVRGSTDSALYMYHAGTWSWVGGPMFGDPSAVPYNNGQSIDVFTLGTDDNIYSFAINVGMQAGWTAVAPGRPMSGPPKAVSKSAGTIDLFAVGENGHLEWIPYSALTGWAGITDLGTMNGSPHHTPVGISSSASNRLDIFTTTETAVAHRAWAGSWASNYDVRPELGSAPSGSPALVSWGSGNSLNVHAFAITRQHQLLHVYWANNTWVNDYLNPMATDAVGDPIVMSQGIGLLDVFYRTTSGTLTHLIFNGSWSVETVASVSMQ
jgi:hypothetical protein